MKRILFGMYLTFVIVALFPLKSNAQTAWVTGFNAKASQENGWKVIDFQGTLKGTDTLISSPFNLFYSDLNFTLSRLFTQRVDSVKITILRQDSYIPGTWVTAKTLATSVAVVTAGYLADTLYTPTASRLVFIGTSGNGYNTNIKAKIRARIK